MTKSIISYALSRLNDTNNGAKKFELLCQKLIPVVVDPNFIPSSGQDAGGDGGIDGWSPLGESGKIKYAFSINIKAKAKLKLEIDKTNPDQYQEIRFFTNQPISEKDKKKFNNPSIYANIKIRIYELDNLIEYIEQHEEIGQFIDLPWLKKNITIDYLKKHNQLLPYRDKISQYIPRTISYWNNKQKELIEISLSGYCSNLPFFTILQAPAGYGKTCALQQLHQMILEKKIDTILPPVYISLASYVPTTLLVIIKDRMTESGDYRCNDFLLLLDGYDEVKDSDRESLIKEIRQLIDNKSLIRKVILSVRENTYNYSDFEVFEDHRISTLSKLTLEDIRNLFLNESITVKSESEFFNNSFFQEFSDNIFYIVKFIDYYKEKQTIAGNVIDLFTFIINQEISRIFRKDKPNESSLESLALYMTINQILEIDKKEISSKFGFNLPMSPFRFSHKSIQEYLAAKKIVKQPLDLIKIILAKGNTIIPYLTNTLGFVLNILNATDDGQEEFDALVNWSLKGAGNAKRLLQIEADKISSEMNHKIFATVIEQEAETGNLFNQPVSLVPFGIREQSRKKNFDYLITQIKALKNTTNKHHYHTSILQSITYHHLGSFDESYQESLLAFLVDLLDLENIDDNQEFIGSLLYSIAHFPILKRIESNKIDFLVSQLLSIETNENIVDNLCQLLLTSDNKSDRRIYLQIYDYILNRILAEREQMAHFVPTQTSDDTYDEPLRVTYWHSFIPLTDKFLKNDLTFVWEIMTYTIKNQEKIIDRHRSSSELDDLFQIYFNAIKIDLEIQEADEKKKRIIIDWIICDNKAYLDSKLWIFLSNFCDSIFLMDLTP